MRVARFVLLVGSMLLLFLPFGMSIQGQATTTPVLRVLDIEGHAVRVRVSGLAGRSLSQPIVVFESGATNTLESWESVFSQLAGSTPLVAYDRAGLGESEWDDETPTPRHVSTRLRRVLQQLDAEPPYVLVGHSWGGSLMRFFAGYHSSDVAGIVYVDPGPIVTQSVADELAPFNQIGSGRAGYEAFWSSYALLIADARPAVRAEFDVYRGLMQREVSDRDLEPAPDVPTVVILAAKPYPPVQGLPFDTDQHFQADLQHRIEVLQDWALESRRGTVVVTNHTSHSVPSEAPELIVWAIRTVLAEIEG